jgi:hypothetical protein
MFGQKARQGRCNGLPQRAGPGAPGLSAQSEIGVAKDDDLTAIVALWLDKHRVHAHVGLDAGGESLQILRDADLTARHDARVVRHVLCLERHDINAASSKRPCQRRRQQALTSRARSALDHQCGHLCRGDSPQPNLRAPRRWFGREPHGPPSAEGVISSTRNRRPGSIRKGSHSCGGAAPVSTGLRCPWRPGYVPASPGYRRAGCGANLGRRSGLQSGRARRVISAGCVDVA